MTIQEFLDEIQEVLQRDDPISMEMPLTEIEEWDSLAIMGIAAFLNHRFNKRLNMDDFNRFVTIADIAEVAEIDQ